MGCQFLLPAVLRPEATGGPSRKRAAQVSVPVYEGVDGRWDDVELDVAGVPVPILVRRTEPAQVARNWPPPLDKPHRCGAVTLAAVHLPVASIEAAAGVYARLLSVESPPALAGPGPGEGLVLCGHGAACPK